jgi:N,N'-diacetyllegionaminate synthase
MSVFIIAEAGVNHNGKIDIALEMVDAASDAGANAVKFQTFRAETLVTRTASKANYQKETSGSNESQFDMLKRLELDLDSHKKLMAHCRERQIDFLSTPFDLTTIDLLSGIGLTTWKIPSGDITNLPYLKKIGSLKQQVILSTGMADLGEIEDALDILENAGTSRKNITVLHCNTEYPTPMQDVNLRAMLTIQQAFPGIQVGYSDHTLGIEVAIAAVAMGAKVIEKHFTLDKNFPGPDHKASLEPVELNAMIGSIRNIERALGDGIKRPSPSEKKNIVSARKSIVAIKPIKKGSLIKKDDLIVLRPGNGISPMDWDKIIGRMASKNFSPGDNLIV